MFLRGRVYLCYVIVFILFMLECCFVVRCSVDSFDDVVLILLRGSVYFLYIVVLIVATL